MNTKEIEDAHNVVRANKIVQVRSLATHGYIRDTLPETIQPLLDAGCILRPVRAKRTAGSRQPALEVPALARDAKIARCPDYQLVQLLGLYAGKVKQGIAPLDQCWAASAEQNTQYQAGANRFVSGIVPDGRWDEYDRNGLAATWLLEYSHGEFERRRLREKMLALGPNPQIWMTPSASHARVIERLLEEIYPLLARKRVIVVDWTGASA